MKSLLVWALAAGLGASAGASVDVNRADQADLEAVRGVGPGLAERILAERHKRAFTDWRDLIRRIGGVGPGSAARLSAAGLTVGGAAYAPAAPAGAASTPTR